MQQCILEGVEVQDSDPIEHWVLNAKNPDNVWSESVHRGSDDNRVCPSMPGTPPTQASSVHDYPVFPDIPSRDISSDYVDYGGPDMSMNDYRPFENSHP